MKLLVPLFAFFSLTLHAERPVWDPESTWVFAVGVLKFDNSNLATWPDEGRADADMIRALQKRGVPSRLVYFPDENHWVLKPQNSLYWYQNVRDWLQRWAPAGARQ